MSDRDWGCATQCPTKQNSGVLSCKSEVGLGKMRCEDLINPLSARGFLDARVGGCGMDGL